MANFRELVKQQRSQGGGVLGSLGTALGQKTLERMDPRNYLFSKSGLMTALFPGMRGYQAGKSTGASTRQIQQAIAPAPVFDKEMTNKFTRIEFNTKLAAKNSMVMPMMARDMNLMRQNMAKLVRINSRGKEVGATKADMFFKRSGERESAYESKFKKERSLLGATKAPASTESKSGGKGFFSSVFGGLLGGIGSIAGGLLSVGGSLIGGIASMIGGIGGAIFKTIGAGLSFLGPIGLLLAAGAGFLIYQLSKSINFDGLKDSFKGIFGTKEGEPSLVQRISDTIKEALGFDKNSNLAGEIAKSLDETFKTNFFKDALVTIVSSYEKFLIYTEGFFQKGEIIFQDMLAKIEQFAVAALAAIAGWQMGKQLPGVLIPDTPSPEDRRQPRGRRGGRGGRGAAGRKAGARAAAGLLARGGGRLILAGLGPIGMAVGLGLTAYELWKYFDESDVEEDLERALKAKEITQEEYNLIKESKQIGQEQADLEEKIEDTKEAIKNIEDASKKAGEGSIAATQLAQSLSDKRMELASYERQMEVTTARTEKFKDKIKGTKPEDSKRDLATAAKLQGVDRAISDKISAVDSRVKENLYGTAGTAPTPVTGDYASRIGQYESGGKYDTIYGQAGGAKINGKSITESTIAEVAAWQDSERQKKTNRHAAGKYQFMDVRSAAALAGIGPNELFNAQNQDKMMQAFTNKNAEYLKARGIEPNAENLAMAHAVGAGGAAALLTAQKGGSGSANALDVLGLTGEARTTNPHLNKSVNEVVASLQSRGKGAAMPGAAPTAAVPKPEEKKGTPLDFFDKMIAGGKQAVAGVLGAAGISKINYQIGDKKETIDLSGFIDNTSRALKDQKNQPPTIVVPPTPAPTIAQAQQGTTAPSATGVVDKDLMQELIRRSSGEYGHLGYGG